MSGPDYHATFWHFLDANERYAAETAIARYLADGWQLHGGPIALPGERVLQALVKPAKSTAPRRDSWRGAFEDGYTAGALAAQSGADRHLASAIDRAAQALSAETAEDHARQSGEDAKP